MTDGRKLELTYVLRALDSLPAEEVRRLLGRTSRRRVCPCDGVTEQCPRVDGCAPFTSVPSPP
jgi:hypothetical protein